MVLLRLTAAAEEDETGAEIVFTFQSQFTIEERRTDGEAGPSSS
jgi:hypothetical protein